jgi:hypothetical protein
MSNSNTKIKIRNEGEFESFMKEIDNELRNQNMAIPLRQIHALKLAAMKLNTDLKGGPLTTGPIPNIYYGDSLSAHIFQWMEQKYGERLKLDFSNGYSVVWLRDDPWLMRFPVIYGTVTVTCERDLTKKFKNKAVTYPGQSLQKPILNLLQCIQGITAEVASSLTEHEMVSLVSYFGFGHRFFNTLQSFCRQEELPMGAVADINQSARYLTDDIPNIGMSMWSSLQATEKLIKYYIEKKGGNYPKVHDLNKLLRVAYKLGLPNIDLEMVKAVQCSASVRYTRMETPIKNVVLSHQCAMHIGSLVALSLFGELAG